MPVAAHLWNCDITLHHSISRHTSPQHSSSSSHITSRIAFPGVAQRGARNRLLLEDLIALLYQYSAHSDAGSPVAFTVYAPTPPFHGLFVLRNYLHPYRMLSSLYTLPHDVFEVVSCTMPPPLGSYRIPSLMFLRDNGHRNLPRSFLLLPSFGAVIYYPLYPP